MSPNIIGSTFILAETAISNTDANNNNKNSAMQPPANTATCPLASAATNANGKVETAVVKANKSNDSNTSTTVKNANSTKQEVAQKKPYKMEIVWHNVLLFIILHSAALYGLYLVFAENAYIDLLLCKYHIQNVTYLQCILNH